MSGSDAVPHRPAAEEFASAVRAQFGQVVDTVLLYGSVARGEARGVESDVDLLVILHADADPHPIEGRIRELAYDIELDMGVILSLIVLPADQYEQRAERPFYRRVREEAEVLYG